MRQFIWILSLIFLPLQYAFIHHHSVNVLRSTGAAWPADYPLMNLKVHQRCDNEVSEKSVMHIFDFSGKESKKTDRLMSLTINSARFLLKAVFLSVMFTYDYQPKAPFFVQKVAVADSTGKYSTKATAKKRYLPRLKKAVVEFKTLGESIENGKDFALISQSYQERIENSYGTALSLYGSSTRSGEYLDDQSREVQDILKNFISDSKSLAKIKDKSEAKQVYSKMKEELEQFLTLCKLEGNIDAEYYTKETPPPSTPVL